jgi:nicotinate-nucleotide adenylyltransferase
MNGLLDAETRLEMINLAIKGNDKFESSDIEIKCSKGQKTYTVKTLILLKELFKDEQTKLYLIIGMDNLAELHKWKEPEKLFLLSEVIVINRPGYYIKDVDNEFTRQVTYVPVTNIDISSTEIRNRISEKRSVKYLIPDDVEKFIIENNLYKQ